MKKILIFFVIAILGFVSGILLGTAILSSGSEVGVIEEVEIIEKGKDVINWADVNLDAMRIPTNVQFGSVTINCETGNVTFADSIKVNEASAEFWKVVEGYFKSNAKIAMRNRLWQEIRDENLIFRYK